jgi:hypothetical protein
MSNKKTSKKASKKSEENFTPPGLPIAEGKKKWMKVSQIVSRNPVIEQEDVEGEEDVTDS